MNSKTLARFTLAAFTAVLTGAVSMAQPTSTQTVLTGTSDWKGVNNDYFDSMNWTSGVPTGSTDIRLPSESPIKTLNIKHDGATNKQVDIYAIRTGANYVYTLNLESVGSGTLTYNITGRGTHPFNTNGDGTGTGNAANRLNFTIKMGNNTRITFSPDAYEGNNGESSTPITTTNTTAAVQIPLPARSTAGLTYAFIEMTGNAVLDFRTMDNYFTVSGTDSDSPGTLRSEGTALVGGFNIGKDAVVYLGLHRGTLSQGVGTGTEELWEGLLIQDEYSPSEGLPSNVGVASLPDGVTSSMLHTDAVSLQTEKWGSGITRVTTTGTVIHPGNMRLRAAGGYVVDGYHRGPILADASAAWVGGKGSIFGNVTINATSAITGGDKAAAGNLAITGTLNLNGALSIDLVDYDHADKINIVGDMVIGEMGKLAVGWTTGNVPIRSGTSTFRVVEVSGGGITGDFQSYSLPQKLRQQASYVLGPDYLDIVFVGYETFAEHPSMVDNYKSVATILDTIHLGSPTSVQPVVDSVYELFDALPSLVYVKQAIDQLTPVAHQAWFPSAVLRTNSMIQSIEDRLMQDAAYGRVARSVQAYLQGWRQESSRQPDAFAAYSNYNTYATLAGADYAFSENTVAGGWLASEDTDYDIDLAGGHSEAQSYTFGAYLRHTRGPWQANAALFYGIDNYDARRDISLTGLGTLAHADTDGSRYGAAVSVAYTHNLPWLEVTPVLGLQWLNWKADGFTETGSENPLIVKSQSETSLQARLGVRISRAFESSRGHIRPYLHMAYVREFETGERNLVSDLFGETLVIKVPGIEANGMRVDAGIDWQLSRKLRFDLHYTAQYNGACDESAGVRGGVTFSF